MLTEKQLFYLLPTLSALWFLLLLSSTLMKPTASVSPEIHTDIERPFYRSYSVSGLSDRKKIRRSTSDDRLQRRIKEIFRLDSEKDALVLFNKTMLSPNFTFINHSKADKSYNNNSLHQQQQFKVQRSPDGKLNLVVNDVIVYLQRPVNAVEPTKDYGAIHFPEEMSKPQDLGNRINLYESPQCVDGSLDTFCTKVSNYPDISESVEKELSKFEYIFGTDAEQPTDISQRINGGVYEESLCSSYSQVIYPEAGTTIYNETKFIVNAGNSYKQGVRVEKCRNEGVSCSYTESFPNNVKTKCKQRFTQRSLLTINHGKTIGKDKFNLPSCCMCIVETAGLN